MSSTDRSHWLKDVAGHAGLELALSDQPEVGELWTAWPLVVEACGLSDEAFTQRAAGYFRIGIADLSEHDPQAVKLIPEAVARRYGIVAVSATESTVLVGTSDPSNRVVHREVAAYSGRQAVFLMASPSKLVPAIERAYAPARAPRNTLQTLVAQVAENDFQIVTSQGKEPFTSIELEAPAVVKLADIVLQQGVRYRATEIHIEPGAKQGRVRYRIDGVLQHVVDLPSTAHQRLVARLKHIARPKPGLEPEDGFDVRVGDVVKQARLVATPSPDGELVWIRLVTPNLVPTLADLGFDGPEGTKIQKVLERREGLLLVTGPARSGATSFVYAALNSLTKQSVISLEGRPEVVLPRVTQIRYDPASGVSFAETLQQLLERSPDVLHAGEVRDLATARIVLRTAVTGRKVLATMHTPDAVSGIRRLIDMGLAPGRLAESLHAIVSLRLVRSLCETCARPFDPEKDAKSREAKLAGGLGVKPLRCAVGCQTCAGTGYMNQVPLTEVLVVTPALRAVLTAGATDAELLRSARAEGMRTFVEVGLEVVAKGETTVEELERVLGVVPTRQETADSVGAVLLVEDDEQDRHFIATVLKDMGFKVVEAGDAAAAQESLKSDEDFSLVIIDLSLPGMHGSELLHVIRRSLSTQSLPIIVVTGSDNPRHEFELLDAGADDYLLKPVVIERLESRVRAVLRRSGVRLASGVPVAS